VGGSPSKLCAETQTPDSDRPEVPPPPLSPSPIEPAKRAHPMPYPPTHSAPSSMLPKAQVKRSTDTLYEWRCGEKVGVGVLGGGGTLSRESKDLCLSECSTWSQMVGWCLHSERTHDASALAGRADVGCAVAMQGREMLLVACTPFHADRWRYGPLKPVH